MSLLDEVLALAPCSIELPAGTGKTEVVAELALQASESGRRTLALTHTHAGIDVLRRRFKRKGVRSANYTIRTLDSWCFALIQSYPLLAGMEVGNEPDWQLSAEYHLAGARAVQSKAIERMLKVSYDLIIVDEYQDCQNWQHELVKSISKVVPTVILGDRMQGLFFFGRDSRPVLWERDVIPAFQDYPIDVYPWRWEGANIDMGNWLLYARQELLLGHPLDLDQAPLRLIDPDEVIGYARQLPGHPERSVLIRKWARDCAIVSAQLGAGFTMMEELEGKHLLEFAEKIDAGGPWLAAHTVRFAVSCAFGVGPIFGAPARRPLEKSIPQPLMESKFAGYEDQVRRINVLLDDQSRLAVHAALNSLGQIPGFRLHRREAWLGILNSLRIACASPELSVRECVVATRNQLRVSGRYPESRVVSRTLLVKGLEFDHCILGEVDDFNSHEIYVGLTRGSQSLLVASRRKIIRPARPTSTD